MPETTINSTFSTTFPNPTPHIRTKTMCVPKKITELLFPEIPPQNGLDTQLEKHQLSVRFNCLSEEKKEKLKLKKKKKTWGKMILEKEEVYC